MRDDELRAAYADVVASRPLQREGCPAPEQLRALVERAGPEPDRRATLDHVMGCSACRREYDLMQSVAAGRAADRQRRLVPLAAAATVVLLFGGTIAFVALRARSEADALRGTTEPVELVNPRGAEGSRPVNFIWRSQPEGAVYTLEVFTPAGDVVYTTETRDTAVALPPDLPLTTGETYHWWVSVHTPDGRDARSSLVSFIP